MTGRDAARRGLRAAAAVLLALAVLLMHTQASAAAPSRAMPSMTNMSAAVAASVAALGHSDDRTAPGSVLLTGPDWPSQHSGGCAGHETLCQATAASARLALAPLSAVVAAHPVAPAEVVGCPPAPTRGPVPAPPRPERALLQVWRN